MNKDEIRKILVENILAIEASNRRGESILCGIEKAVDEICAQSDATELPNDLKDPLEIVKRGKITNIQSDAVDELQKLIDETTFIQDGRECLLIWKDEALKAINAILNQKKLK